MEDFSKIWRAFFAIGLLCIAVQQLIVGDLLPVIMLPSYPAWLTPRLAWTWGISIAMAAACIAILFELKGRTVSILLGILLLLLFALFQIPGNPGPKHIGSWINPLKEFALAGGAFIVAGSFPPGRTAPDFVKLLENLIPFGKCFFGIMLIVFGVSHFAYPDFCAALVPNWIPWHYFWMYFAAVALILGGLGILLFLFSEYSVFCFNAAKLAALFTGIMIFLWVIMLHIPRAIADPHSGNGNEWTSVFEALAFSGIAFILAGKRAKTTKL